MRKLPPEQRATILKALVEGNSISATARLCGVSKITILRLLADAGTLARQYHDLMVRDLDCERVQCDEIWSFIFAKQRNVRTENWCKGYGDCWVWVSICADTKLVINWTTGGRDAAARYSPPVCCGCDRTPVIGNPDRRHISTSFIERQNLTMRMNMRRFTRLTNGFSKRRENHDHAVALHYFYYNFIRKHQTIKTTPAVAAGVADRPWTMLDFVKLLEREEMLTGGRLTDYRPAASKKKAG